MRAAQPLSSDRTVSAHRWHRKLYELLDLSQEAVYVSLASRSCYDPCVPLHSVRQRLLVQRWDPSHVFLE